MIGRNGERRSGISAQAARHDDDDDFVKPKAKIKNSLVICGITFLVCQSTSINDF